MGQGLKAHSQPQISSSPVPVNLAGCNLPLGRDAGLADERFGMPTILAVAVMGGLGALARYGIERGFVRSSASFPWGTILVNVSGSFVLGLLYALAIERVQGPEWVRLGLTVGLLGGFTTFSTFSLQTFRLIEEGSHGAAVGNALGSLALGLVAVTIGVIVGRVI